MTDVAVRAVLEERSERGLVTLTVSDASSEFRWLMRNWACHLRKLKVPAVVWSLDLATHYFVTARAWRGISSVFTSDLVLPPAHRSRRKLPGSDSYLQAVARKPMACARVLAMHLSVLFVDVDVAVLRDPRNELHLGRANLAELCGCQKSLLITSFDRIWLRHGSLD